MAKGGKKAGGKKGATAAGGDEGRPPPPPPGPKNMSKPEAQKWAASHWDYCQQEAAAAQAKLEEVAITARWRPGDLQSEMLHDLRERRAMGLARAREITKQKAAAEGHLAVPALLCTRRGSNEERWLLGYQIAPPAAAPGEEPVRLESDPDPRSVKEIADAMPPESMPAGALPTVAFPRSNRPVLLEERPYTPRGQSKVSTFPAATA